MSDDPSVTSIPERKPLTPAAQRALAEAEARRKAAADAKPMPTHMVMNGQDMMMMMPGMGMPPASDPSRRAKPGARTND